MEYSLPITDYRLLMAHYALILLVAAVAESACHWLKCVQCRLTL